MVSTERAAVLIYFEIDREGQVRGQPKIKQSSGNELYDQSALRPVSESILPAASAGLPRAVPESQLRVQPGDRQGLACVDIRPACSGSRSWRQPRSVCSRSPLASTRRASRSSSTSPRAARTSSASRSPSSRAQPDAGRGQLRPGVPEIIGNDLRFSALFTVANTPALPAAQDAVKQEFGRLQQAGAHAVMHGLMRIDGQRLTIEFRLYDLTNPEFRLIASKMFWVEPLADHRRLAHRIADEVVYQFTGSGASRRRRSRTSPSRARTRGS